ncbi:MAG: RNA polymerase sporulation sigma factor SigK [Bacilli bacterium]|nr:RNA polymerase sporulation sigma factor SigK [Bacilli bacterium]
MKKMKRFVRRVYYKIIQKEEIFYVGATDVLPEPLSSEEENYYISLKEQGYLEGKEKLIEHNLRLVVFLAKKYENTGVDLEDLVSIGSIGLIKGINTFNQKKNIKLATYVSRCIDNEILMFLRKNKKVRQEVSIEESLSYDGDGNELHLEDVIGTDKDSITKCIEEDHDKRIMLEEINQLKPRDRDIMIMRYGLLGNDEYTQKEVADKLGISQSYISRIEKKVIKKLKVLVNH